MRNHFGIGFGLALIASTAATGAFAEEMSSDEILRRLEMQQNETSRTSPAPASGAMRGIALNYGTETQAGTDPGATRGITLYQGEDTGAQTTYGVELAPTEQPAGTIATTPLNGYQTLPETTEVTYQPVQEEARIDLRIYFEWNSASLKPEAIGQLSQLCSAIEQVVGQNVFNIIGHTDKSGSDQYNLYLSEARAREVKRHLVEECAIPQEALRATGQGERQSNPGSPQRDPSERRVEVQLVS